MQHFPTLCLGGCPATKWSQVKQTSNSFVSCDARWTAMVQVENNWEKKHQISECYSSPSELKWTSGPKVDSKGWTFWWLCEVGSFLTLLFFPEKFIFPPPPEILFALPSWGSVWDAVTSNPMTSVPNRFLGCTTLHETNSLPLKIHLFLLSRCYVSFREGIEDWF